PRSTLSPHTPLFRSQRHTHTHTETHTHTHTHTQKHRLRVQEAKLLLFPMRGKVISSPTQTLPNIQEHRCTHTHTQTHTHTHTHNHSKHMKGKKHHRHTHTHTFFLPSQNFSF